MALVIAILSVNALVVFLVMWFHGDASFYDLKYRPPVRKHRSPWTPTVDLESTPQAMWRSAYTVDYKDPYIEVPDSAGRYVSTQVEYLDQEEEDDHRDEECKQRLHAHYDYQIKTIVRR